MNGQIMGHVLDTPHVRRLEDRYNRALVGFSARWRVAGDVYRTEIFDRSMHGQWCGVYPLRKEDLEVYNVSDDS